MQSELRAFKKQTKEQFCFIYFNPTEIWEWKDTCGEKLLCQYLIWGYVFIRG